MYSISTRFNNIFFHWLITIAFLASLNHITGRWVTFNPKLDTSFEVTKFKEFLYLTQPIKQWYKPNWDYLNLNFDLKINGLDTADNWNLKQAFVWLQASHDDQNRRNIQIIWDQIIPREEIQKMKTFKLNSKILKYPIRDVFRNLRGQEVKISLHIEFMPIFGFITYREYYETQLQVPKEYTHSERNK